MDAAGRDKVGRLMYNDAWSVRIDNGILDQNVDKVIANVRFEDKREVAARKEERRKREVIDAVVLALQDCITTAAELRRNISPDQGCGYFLYRETWEASFAAETRAKIALTALGIETGGS